MVPKLVEFVRSMPGAFPAWIQVVAIGVSGVFQPRQLCVRNLDICKGGLTEQLFGLLQGRLCSNGARLGAGEGAAG